MKLTILSLFLTFAMFAQMTSLKAEEHNAGSNAANQGGTSNQDDPMKQDPSKQTPPKE